MTPIARLLGLRVVVTNHGPDYDRDKWGPFAKWVLRTGERLGMRCANGSCPTSGTHPTLETQYRVAVNTPGAPITSSYYDTLNREVEPEQSFARLVLYLDLVCPSNRLSADLRDLNSRRNRIFHRLFAEFDSVEHLRDQLRQFCRDCTNLNAALRNLVATKVIPVMKAAEGKTEADHAVGNKDEP